MCDLLLNGSLISSNDELVVGRARQDDGVGARGVEGRPLSLRNQGLWVSVNDLYGPHGGLMGGKMFENSTFCD